MLRMSHILHLFKIQQRRTKMGTLARTVVITAPTRPITDLLDGHQPQSLVIKSNQKSVSIFFNRDIEGYDATNPLHLFSSDFFECPDTRVSIPVDSSAFDNRVFTNLTLQAEGLVIKGGRCVDPAYFEVKNPEDFQLHIRAEVEPSS